jgi:hypothetical protein
MATVVREESAGSGIGSVLGIILLIAVVLLFFVYGLPLLRGGTGGTQLNLPSTVNVNPK